MICWQEGEPSAFLVKLFTFTTLLSNACCSSAQSGQLSSLNLSSCWKSNSQIPLKVNDSWKPLTARVSTYVTVSSKCTVNLSIVTSDEAAAQTLPAPSRLLLLRIDDVNLQPSEHNCDNNSTSLALLGNETVGYICNLTQTVYVWASENLLIYLHLPRLADAPDTTSSLNFSVIAPSATNMCLQSSNGSAVVVKGVHYVFAPDHRYAMILPKDMRCSGGNNYFVTIWASSSYNQLIFTVLASPGTPGCGSLCYKLKCFTHKDTYVPVADEQVTLQYSSGNCHQDNRMNSSGFTMMIEIGNKSLPNGTGNSFDTGSGNDFAHADTAWIAGVSAAAAAALVCAFIAAKVIIGRQRDSSLPIEAPIPSSPARDDPLLMSDAANAHFSNTASSCRQPKITYNKVQFGTEHCISGESDGNTPMIENDLYGISLYS